MLVAHDRWFLEAVGTAVLEMEAGRTRYFKGTWTAWRKEQAARELALGRAIEKQQAEIARMEAFVERFRAKATKARQAQDRMKKLAKIERIERDPRDNRELALPVQEARALGPDRVRARGRAQSRSPAAVLLDKAELWLERGEHVSLVGPNGVGKTTLIETLAGRRPLARGKIRTGHNVKLGYLSQHAEELEWGGARTVLEAAAEAHRAVAQPGAEPARALPVQRRGGREAARRAQRRRARRLSLAILVASDANVLILDEPTNHLDLESREALEDALQRVPGLAAARQPRPRAARRRRLAHGRDRGLHAALLRRRLARVLARARGAQGGRHQAAATARARHERPHRGDKGSAPRSARPAPKPEGPVEERAAQAGRAREGGRAGRGASSRRSRTSSRSPRPGRRSTSRRSRPRATRRPSARWRPPTPRSPSTRSGRSRNRHRKSLHMGNIRAMNPRLGLNLHRNHWPTAPALKAHEAAGFSWVQVHTPPWPMLCGRERTRLHARALRRVLDTTGLRLVLHGPDDLTAGAAPAGPRVRGAARLRLRGGRRARRRPRAEHPARRPRARRRRGAIAAAPRRARARARRDARAGEPRARLSLLSRASATIRSRSATWSAGSTARRSGCCSTSATRTSPARSDTLKRCAPTTIVLFHVHDNLGARLNGLEAPGVDPLRLDLHLAPGAGSLPWHRLAALLRDHARAAHARDRALQPRRASSRSPRRPSTWCSTRR